jgi:hypothetical protein
MRTETKIVLAMADAGTKNEQLELARQFTEQIPRGQRVKLQNELLEQAQKIKDLRLKRLFLKTSVSHTLAQRFRAFILRQASEQISRRRLQSTTWGSPDQIDDRVVNEEGCFALVSKEGFYHYSNQYGDRYRRVCWLYGYTDGQRWAVRVPAECATVAEALDWLTPAAVKKAKSEGRWVARQGDVYLVELKAGKDNLRALFGTRHDWDEENRVLCHPEHPPVNIPGHVIAVRAYAQTQIARNGGRMAAD